VFFQNGVLYANSKTRFADVTDGTTNVFLVGESRYMPVPKMRADGIHAGWASSLKADSTFAVPLTFAGAVLQINAQKEFAVGGKYIVTITPFDGVPFGESLQGKPLVKTPYVEKIDLPAKNGAQDFKVSQK